MSNPVRIELEGNPLAYLLDRQSKKVSREEAVRSTGNNEVAIIGAVMGKRLTAYICEGIAEIQDLEYQVGSGARLTWYTCPLNDVLSSAGAQEAKRQMKSVPKRSKY